MGNSLAIIEVVGMPCAILAGDIAVKAANVELLGYELTRGSGFIAVKLRGDVGSVKAAAEAVTIALDTSQIVGHIVIPRPSEAVEEMIKIDNMNLKGEEPVEALEDQEVKAEEKKVETIKVEKNTKVKEASKKVTK